MLPLAPAVLPLLQVVGWPTPNALLVQSLGGAALGLAIAGGLRSYEFPAGGIIRIVVEDVAAIFGTITANGGYSATTVAFRRRMGEVLNPPPLYIPVLSNQKVEGLPPNLTATIEARDARGDTSNWNPNTDPAVAALLDLSSIVIGGAGGGSIFLQVSSAYILGGGRLSAIGGLGLLNGGGGSGGVIHFVGPADTPPGYSLFVNGGASLPPPQHSVSCESGASGVVLMYTMPQDLPLPRKDPNWTKVGCPRRRLRLHFPSWFSVSTARPLSLFEQLLGVESCISAFAVLSAALHCSPSCHPPGCFVFPSPLRTLITSRTPFCRSMSLSPSSVFRTADLVVHWNHLVSRLHGTVLRTR